MNFQGLGVGVAPAAPGDFLILDAAELVVLLPEIGFEYFECRKEPEYGHVSFCYGTAAFRGQGGWRSIDKQSGAERSGTEREARSQEVPAAGEVGGPVLDLTDLMIAH